MVIQKPLVMGHLESSPGTEVKTIWLRGIVKVRFLLYPQMNYHVSQPQGIGSKSLGVAAMDSKREKVQADLHSL